jgi:hypothetical protein
MWTFAVTFARAHFADVTIFAGECRPRNATTLFHKLVDGCIDWRGE